MFKKFLEHWKKSLIILKIMHWWDILITTYAMQVGQDSLGDHEPSAPEKTMALGHLTQLSSNIIYY